MKQTMTNIIGLIPLCVSVLITAVVLELAGAARERVTAEDALPPPLTDFIPVSVWLFLAMGYLISIVIMVIAFRRPYKA